MQSGKIWRQSRDGFHRFWLEPQPCEFLGIWRIGLGLFLIFLWLFYFHDGAMLWGTNSLISAETEQKFASGWSLFWYFTDQDTALRIIGGLLLATSVTFTVGFYTRLSAALIFVAVYSFQMRVSFLLNQGDQLFRILLLLVCFAPVAEAYSIDSWLKSKKLSRSRRLQPQWSVRLLQVQLSVLYLNSLLCKLTGSDWPKGDAIYYVTRQANYAKFTPAFLFSNLNFMRALTWGTLAIEFALGILIWYRPLRYAVLAAGLILHFGIRCTLHITRFEDITILSLLLFIIPEDFNQFKDNVKSWWVKSQRL